MRGKWNGGRSRNFSIGMVGFIKVELVSLLLSTPVSTFRSYKDRLEVVKPHITVAHAQSTKYDFTNFYRLAQGERVMKPSEATDCWI